MVSEPVEELDVSVLVDELEVSELEELEEEPEPVLS